VAKVERITVETSEYEFSHGKRPCGQGTWAFTFDRRSYVSIDEVWWTPFVTWSDARRRAVTEARRRGATTAWAPVPKFIDRAP
jgi:hypothetical protein